MSQAGQADTSTSLKAKSACAARCTSKAKQLFNRQCGVAMGQDDGCGICGKHYQTCKHHRKEHLSHPGGHLPLCGGDTAGGYFSFAHDSDPDNLCKRCGKVLAAIARTDFAMLCLTIRENA